MQIIYAFSSRPEIIIHQPNPTLANAAKLNSGMKLRMATKWPIIMNMPGLLPLLPKEVLFISLM